MESNADNKSLKYTQKGNTIIIATSFVTLISWLKKKQTNKQKNKKKKKKNNLVLEFQLSDFYFTFVIYVSFVYCNTLLYNHDNGATVF